MIDAPCDLCNKQASELYAYKHSKVIYRGKEIECSWLCRKCVMIEKEKAWKEERVYGVHILMND